MKLGGTKIYLLLPKLKLGVNPNWMLYNISERISQKVSKTHIVLWGYTYVGEQQCTMW